MAVDFGLGDQMFRYKQSSLIPLLRKPMSPNKGAWIAFGPNFLACKTPLHGFGSIGSLHLKAPTGGNAKGTPLKLAIFVLVSKVPSKVPYLVFTWVVNPYGFAISCAFMTKVKKLIRTMKKVDFDFMVLFFCIFWLI